MTCRTCGRPAENGQATHWLGCEQTGKTVQRGNVTFSTNTDVCEHGDCMDLKKEYSGRGAKPKYCDEHSDPKNRK
jgi:hypothetical protein